LKSILKNRDCVGWVMYREWTERGPVKALQLTLKGSKQGRPKKRWEEMERAGRERHG